MDSKRNFVDRIPFYEFLRGQDFAAILKNYAVFHTLLQSVPNRVLQIGLCGQMQKFNRTPEHLDLQVRKSVELCNAEGVKSVGSTPVQCVDHLVPLCSGTFSFSVLGVGAG